MSASQAIVIRGGRVIDPASGTDKVQDVRIEGEQIVALGAGLSTSGAKVIDATGKWVVPGLIDMHVHLREPGEEYKEDIASGSAAAVAGGFTTVLAMPNTKPVIDSAEVVAYVLAKGKAAGLARVLTSGAVTVGQKGETLAPFGELKRAGCVALTDDGHPVSSAGLFRHALAYATNFDLPILTHAEEKTLSKGGFMHEGPVSTRLGLRGIPRLAEDVAVARDISLAEYTGARLHICHVSTRGATELVRAAKARGVRVTAEAAPHHFTLTHEAVVGYNCNAKMSPPLREDEDRLALVEGLASGVIDAIATDHAPHSTLEKDITFDEAANGIIGLQTALPLTLDLVRAKHLTAMQAIERMTLGPARVLGLSYGRLSKGAVADITVIDPDLTWTPNPTNILSKSKNTPFVGATLTGAALWTMVAGNVVFERS